MKRRDLLKFMLACIMIPAIVKAKQVVHKQPTKPVVKVYDYDNDKYYHYSD